MNMGCLSILSRSQSLQKFQFFFVEFFSPSLVSFNPGCFTVIEGYLDGGAHHLSVFVGGVQKGY